MTALQKAPSPRYVIADAKLSHEADAPNLHALGFMSRIPNTIARQRAYEAIAKQCFPLQAQRFATPEAAPQALAALAKDWTYHQLEASRLIGHKRYARKRRPTPHTPLKASECPIDSRVRPNEEAMGHRMQVNACFVLGTHISASALSDPEVIAAYKGQAQVEGGFRFLKDPLFFCLVVVC